MNRKAVPQKLILVFVILNGFFIGFKNWLTNKGVDQEVLIVGNLVIFLVALVSFLLTRRNLNAENPHAFVRGIYGSFIFKFFVIAAAAFIYFFSVKEINKPALFICMGLYFVYTFIEVSTLLRLLKQKKNA